MLRCGVVPTLLLSSSHLFLPRSSKASAPAVCYAASVVLIGVLLLVYFRKHILLWCLKRSGKSLQEIQLDNNKNSREWALQHAVSVALGWVTSQLPPVRFTGLLIASYHRAALLGWLTRLQRNITCCTCHWLLHLQLDLLSASVQPCTTRLPSGLC